MTMNNKHEDNDDSSSAADSVNNSDNFNRADNVNRTDDRTADTCSTGKIIARYMLASALVTLLMVLLSELSGSAAPVGALLLLLVVRSLFDL